ncbi:MAG: ABC transporter permease [Vicinamibacterales bacterium]
MPDWCAEVRRRLEGASLRPEREAEIIDEVAQHLADRYQTLLATGCSVQEAEAGARRELDEGDAIGRRVARVETAPPAVMTAREAERGAGVFSGFWQDLRYAVRVLRQRPLLSGTAILTIALSLGPTTAVLGMAESLFFEPLPGIARQDRLLTYMFGTAHGESISPRTISYADADDIARGAVTITGMAGYQMTDAALAAEGGDARLVQGAAISTNYFDLLGVQPIAGRTFRPEEDRNPGGEPILVLSDGRARELFGSAGAAVGRTMLINSLPFTVIGVIPSTFAGTERRTTVDFWITGMAYRRVQQFPVAHWRYAPNYGPFYSFIVRMTDGATVEQTTAELKTRTRALAEQNPQQNKLFETVGPILQPGFAAPASLRPIALRAMELIAAVAALLVLLGMANVANLLIFRSLAGARDIATRKALGASTRRLVQLRLLESITLAFAGAAAGIGVAVLIGAVFSDFIIPGIGPIRLTVDWRVLALTAGLAVLVGAGFGVGPAILTLRESVTGALGRGVRTEPPRVNGVRRVLASAQIAISFTLLVAALLFLATLRNLHAVDLGFDPSGVVLVNESLQGHGYTDARALDYNRRLLDTVRRGAGVQSVAVALAPPLFGFQIGGGAYLPGTDPARATEVAMDGVSSDYFRVLDLPLVRGRAFTDEEAFNPRADEVPSILSETLARTLFGSIDVIGRELRTPFYNSPSTVLRVVGVTGPSRFASIDRPPAPVLYQPLARFPSGLGSFVLVRSDLGEAAAARVVASAAAAIDPAVPVAADRTFAAVIDQRLGEQRLLA